MRCPNCSYTSEKDFKFCPECGAPAPEGHAPPDQPESAQPESAQPGPSVGQEAERQARLQSERIAYVRHDYDPCRDGHFPHPGAAAAPCEPGVSPDLPHVPVHTGYPSEPPRPATTGTILFAIFNMLCCGFGISMILGLLALIFAIMATSDTSLEEAGRKIGWARTLNFIGLAFIILQAIVLVILIVSSIFLAADGSWFTPEAFNGDFPMG